MPASAGSTLGTASFDEVTLNEAETRAELIDPALREAGWGVVGASRGYWGQMNVNINPMSCGSSDPLVVVPVYLR